MVIFFNTSNNFRVWIILYKQHIQLYWMAPIINTLIYNIIPWSYLCTACSNYIRVFVNLTEATCQQISDSKSTPTAVYLGSHNFSISLQRWVSFLRIPTTPSLKWVSTLPVSDVRYMSKHNMYQQYIQFKSAKSAAEDRSPSKSLLRIHVNSPSNVEF